jgi:hypothetical protein
MIKTINILLIIALVFVILFLSIQRKKRFKIDALKSTEKIIYLTYNNISIKQIDSLSSNTNLKFSELIAERIKIN